MASSKKVRGLLVEIGGDTSKLETALKKVDKTTGALNKELRGINTLLKFDPSNTTLLNQKATVLSETIKETQTRLQALQQAQKELDAAGIDKNTSDYRELEREIENTTRKIKELQKEASNWTIAGRKLDELGNKISSVGNKIDELGNKLTTGLTLPVATAGIYFTKTAIDFESSFAGVRKTVDATEEEFSELRSGIIDMSKELPASANEIARVGEAAGQLGIQKSAILSFTKTMVDLGEATNMTSDEAATALARFANITQMSQKDFDKLGSVITDLGNKLATTESEIVAMGLRLAGAGAQVGMTEDQILSFAAALSSVGIEAEAGGSAFSRVMVEMQTAVETGGDYLEQFAEVAGMSASEFKNAFEDNAANAIIAFVNGLAGLDESGKSAITVLNDMGLSEIRLRDALLRASGASNVFNDALEIGNKAWKENTALTKEAEQRYKTTESQWEIAKNKVNALAISFGDNLLPHINELLDAVGNLMDNFSKLSKEEQKNILKTMAFVAAIGPAVKITGKFTNAVGKGVEFAGKFSEAMGTVKSGTKATDKTVATLAKTISGLSSPFGVAVVGITAFVGLMTALNNVAKKQYEEFDKLKEKVEEQTAARQELINTQQTQLTSSLSEVNNVDRLASELQLLVDANGKVNEGYEKRVDFILSELNNAFGTEYKAVDGIIQQYDKLNEQIDQNILKKKAKIILDTQEEQYKAAIENQTAAYQTLAKAQDQVNKAQTNLNNAQKEFDDYVAKNGDNPLDQRYVELRSSLEGANNHLRQVKDTYNEAKEVADGYYNDIITYETNSALVMEGSAESLNKVISSIGKSYVENGKTIKLALDDQIYNQVLATQQAEEQYKKRKDIADEYEKATLESTMINNQKQLNEIINGLIAQTSAVNKNSPSVVNAWKTLAETSNSTYRQTLSTLPEDLRNVIVSMTGVPYEQAESANTSFSNLASGQKQAYKSSMSELPGITSASIGSMADAINKNSDKPEKEADKLSNAVMSKFDRYEESYNSGVNYVRGIKSGLSNKVAQGEVFTAASNLANKVLSTFNSVWDIHSPSKASGKRADMLVAGVVVHLKKGEKRVVDATRSLSEKVLNAMDFNSTNFSKMNSIQGYLNQKVTDATRTIFTTPQINFYVQEMDKENLDKAFNYINNKFGSQY